ncbi:TVP38/TMEM64 family protein [Bacillus sp. ISL-35]|uniref:TVP38/TMEM64 family protein n=1 Tax=Bacillus sp. ISL-35 TaxID=2819122 RepID=UPI001BEB8A79|nr:VTT domain-containing protein [Bacillus sp. ISL-35]MBT2679118.1 TVP38/TMEM64 family protein [Bacillus sp. ISL-35]MBT2702799.1 TVP38/TMEM64 family protein [Chryseobacterium sp. ISL-80]
MALLDTLSGQPVWIAVLISLTVSITISILGVIPSAFVTAANIIYFGFSGGLILSIIGEAAGAIISFFLYRKGVKKLAQKINSTKPIKGLERLKSTAGTEAFILVILLRLFPFAPSGLVTLAASYSKMGAPAFMVSSTIGKIPALFIESYSVHTLLGWKTEYQLSMTVFAVVVGVCYYYWTTKKRKRRM